MLKELTFAHNFFRQQNTPNKIRIVTNIRQNMRTKNKEPHKKNT
jgi:hypothetical protein